MAIARLILGFLFFAGFAAAILAQESAPASRAADAPDPLAFRRSLQDLDAADPARRLAAARALREDRREVVLRHRAARLHLETDPRVLTEILAAALAQVRHAPSFLRILDIARTSGDPAVRAAALDAIFDMAHAGAGGAQFTEARLLAGARPNAAASIEASIDPPIAIVSVDRARLPAMVLLRARLPDGTKDRKLECRFGERPITALGESALGSADRTVAWVIERADDPPRATARIAAEGTIVAAGLAVLPPLTLAAAHLPPPVIRPAKAIAAEGGRRIADPATGEEVLEVGETDLTIEVPIDRALVNAHGRIRIGLEHYAEGTDGVTFDVFGGTNFALRAIAQPILRLHELSLPAPKEGDSVKLRIVRQGPGRILIARVHSTFDPKKG